MLIDDHKGVASLGAAIAAKDDWRWLRAMPMDVLRCLLAPVAQVAEWIATQRLELLSGEELCIAVAGSPLDSFESGAIWSTLAAMLGKEPGWVAGSVQVNGGEPVGSMGGPPIAPLYATTRIGVAQVPRDIAGLAQIVNSKTALVVSTVGSPLVPACVLCSGRDRVEQFLARGGAMVSLAQCEQDAVVMSGAAMAAGMLHGISKSKFASKEPGASLEWVFWQTGPVSTSVEKDRLTSFAEFTTELSQALESMRSPLADDCSDAVSEDVMGWGVRGLLQSSLDAQDTYITLPRTVALRTRTNTIVRVERGLAVDELPIRVDPEALVAYGELGESWIERSGWAATLWNSGLGQVIDSTLMGRMQKMGLDVGAAAFSGSVEAMLQGSGMDAQTVQQLTQALTGGEPYAPSKGERLVHHHARKGDMDQVWELVRVEKGLANALNERREPLLVAVANHGRKEHVHRLVALGANVNGMDGGGRTVLGVLAASGPIESIATLIELGARVNEPDPLRWTPLLIATKRGRWDVAGLLVDRGADVNWPGADGVSALGFVQGDAGGLDELDRMTDVLDGLYEGMGLPKMQGVLKGNGLVAAPSDVPAWLLKKIQAAA